MNSFYHSDPPQPSYELADLWSAVGQQYWFPIALTGALVLAGRWTAGKHARRVEPLSSKLPLLFWGLQMTWVLYRRFEWPFPPYILWHDFFVAMLALGALLVCLILGECLEKPSVTKISPWMSPTVWAAVVVAAPVLDFALYLFFISPIRSVFRS